MFRTFDENNVILTAGTPDVISGATNGPWLKLNKYGRRITFLAAVGAAAGLSGNCVMIVQEATSSAGANAAAISGKTGTFTATTDAGKQGKITVRMEDLIAGYPYVRAVLTPASGTPDTSIVAIISELYEQQAAGTQNSGLAFNVGE